MTRCGTGDGRIVVEVAGDMQGQASGALVTWSFWQVASFRDGLAVKLTWFADRAEALEAAGVRSPN